MSFEAALARVRPSVVSITCTKKKALPRAGAGVVVDRDGGVLTVAHLVRGCAATGQAGGHTGALRLLAEDAAADLALMRLEGPGQTTPAALARALAVGEPVATLGRPLGLPLVATAGIVSAVDLPPPEDAPLRGVRLVATDAASAQGSSGGPLVLPGGAVAGIVILTHAEARLTLALGPGEVAAALGRLRARTAPRAP